MKTTIKSQPHRVIIESAPDGCVLLSIAAAHCRPEQSVTVTLTSDQVGAVLHGIEQAAEAARIAQERAELAG